MYCRTEINCCRKILLKVAGKTEENSGKNYKYDFSYEEIAGLMKKILAHIYRNRKVFQAGYF